MILYQLDGQNRRCKEIAVPLDKGRWVSNQWLKSITLYFEDFEIFEPYRYFPEWCYKANPEITDADCKIDSVYIDFRFTQNKSIKVFGVVCLPYSDLHISHKLKVNVSALELAKVLSYYFATSTDQRGHTVTFLQGLYWHFMEWCTHYFSIALDKLEVEDQECYISALYDAFKELAVNPYIPSEPGSRGKATIRWMERGEDGVCGDEHYLFMDKAGHIFHYCESKNILFDSVD